MTHVLTWRNGLSESEAAEIALLLTETAEADGAHPVSEDVRLRLRQSGPAEIQIEPVQGDVMGSEHFVVRDGAGLLLGYAHLDGGAEPPVAELAVHPAHRRAGVGTRLVTALTERAPHLKVWSHSQDPAAEVLARKFGFTVTRELWQMRAPLHDDFPEPRWPQGIQVRTFVPGQDEGAVVEVNAKAFAWHPEQGRMSVADVRAREAEAWFDPAGFFLAVDENDRLAGFHWTKIVDGLGEVYVVGVDPESQGGGLGKALTLAGLRHLRGRELAEVMLYVERDNEAAVHVYQKLGFTRASSDVQYTL
ncbi:mycothiol synthase [Pseudonocardiaceae bacterium YIM PH 21723]|nr:mycothiol synthase [Pseudonocardiaceae bacterium YIM PH 21723]